MNNSDDLVVRTSYLYEQNNNKKKTTKIQKRIKTQLNKYPGDNALIITCNLNITNLFSDEWTFFLNAICVK